MCTLYRTQVIILWSCRFFNYLGLQCCIQGFTNCTWTFLDLSRLSCSLASPSGPLLPMCCCACLTISAVRTCKIYSTWGFLVVPIQPCDVNPSLQTLLESCIPNPPTMPLERSDALLDLSDPNIVLGPCKHCATECLLENGNPLAYKKSKAVSSASADKDNHTSLSSLMLPPTHPTHTAPDPRLVLP